MNMSGLVILINTFIADVFQILPLVDLTTTIIASEQIRRILFINIVLA